MNDMPLDQPDPVRSPAERVFEEVGLDYVSCSPFRVPVARLVAGQVGER